MSNYSPANDFSAFDDLAAGSGGDKIISGVEWDEETAAIQTATNSKYDSTDIASQAQAEAGAVNTVLVTPQRMQEWADNKGLLKRILKYKATDQTETNSSLEDDDDLKTYTVANGGVYKIKGSLLFSLNKVSTANVTIGFQVTSATYFGIIISPQTPSVDWNHLNTVAGSITAELPANSVLQPVRVEGVIKPADTNIDFQWHAGGESITLHAGSWIALERIA